MSWDIFVQDIPPGIKSVEDMPNDFAPRPLGPRQAIIEKITSVVPTADFTDPSWGLIDGPGYSIEVSLGEHSEVTDFAFHVRGGGMAAYVVADILETLGLRAFDPGADTGLFAIEPDGSESQRKWRAYRDRVLNRQ